MNKIIAVDEMISESKQNPMNEVETLRTTVKVESQRFKTIKINNEPQNYPQIDLTDVDDAHLPSVKLYE